MKGKRSAGQNRPGDLSRCIAQGLRSSKAPPKKVCLAESEPSGGNFPAATRGLMADAFFGASPVVATALGIRSGATPRGRHQRTMASPTPRSKQDISTLLGIGHFCFALTGADCFRTPRERPGRVHRCNAVPWPAPWSTVRALRACAPVAYGRAMHDGFSLLGPIALRPFLLFHHQSLSRVKPACHVIDAHSVVRYFADAHEVHVRHSSPWSPRLGELCSAGLSGGGRSEEPGGHRTVSEGAVRGRLQFTTVVLPLRYSSTFMSISAATSGLAR
jgi:hypothetical protein